MSERNSLTSEMKAPKINRRAPSDQNPNSVILCPTVMLTERRIEREQVVSKTTEKVPALKCIALEDFNIMALDT